MALSFVQYVSNGQIYSVPFTYVNKSHVSVMVDGQPVEFSWNSNSVVRLASVPAEGKVVEIRRTTPNAQRLVDFVDGSTLTEGDLDTASTQFLYLSQEANDRAASNPTLTPQGTFDFAGRRSVNAADPVDAQDLVTKHWVLTQAAIEGPQGPAGSVGPAGPVGPAGVNGKDGAAGPAGPAGTVDQTALNAKVDKADPQMAAPPFVTFPAPALVSSVPQTAIDQNGVLCLGHIGADLTGTSPVDTIVQRALDAIGTRVANSTPPGSPVGGGRRYGSVLQFPMGSRCRFQSGVAFGYDGPIAVVGGTGSNRDAVHILQECQTLFDFTCTSPNAASGNLLALEIGGMRVSQRFAGGTVFRVRDVDHLYAHDLRYASDGDAGGFSNAFFDMKNIRTSTFERMYVRNDTNKGTKADTRGIFANMTTTVGSTSNRFDKIIAQGFDIGFNMVNASNPGIEGITISDSEIFNVGSCIEWHNQDTSGYLPLQLQVMNSHLRAFRSWVNCSRVADLKLIGNEMEADERFGNADALLNLVSVEGFDISHNRIVAARSGSTLVCSGNTNKGIFANNTGDAVGTPIVVQCLSPSRNIKSHDNCLSLSGGATFFAGDATKNNRSQNDRAALYPGETAPADPVAPVQAPSWAGTTVIAVASSAVAQTLDISVPGGIFSATPIAAVVPASPGPVPIVCTVDYGNCSATNIRVVFQRIDGQIIGAGSAYRFNAVARAAN